MQCAETLGIAPPQVYIVNSPQLNAATYGTNDDSFIMVHSALVDHFTDEELLSVIGHECGHIHNNHVVYLTTLHYLTHMAAAFSEWIVDPGDARARALVAPRRDHLRPRRPALLEGPRVSTRALTKLALGSQKLYDEFDIDAFLEQYEEGKDGIGRYMEVFATHPWLPKRVLAHARLRRERALPQGTPGLGDRAGSRWTRSTSKVHGIIKVGTR